MHILSATAIALGHQIDDLILNRWSLSKYRQDNRTKIAAEKQASYQVRIIFPDPYFLLSSYHKYLNNFSKQFECSNALVIHWDGKKLDDTTGSTKVERLPIIATHSNDEQLLAVPKLSDGSGKTIATAVFETLKEWHLVNKSQAACFDTTAANTGASKGAAVLPEKMLKRDLLYLPCRHHIGEIILREE